jgi:uracil-DNA glycosylase
MDLTLAAIKSCTICTPHLELLPRPVVTAGKTCKIVIIGQAPGRKVHATGIPWNDPSGELLRTWMGLDKEVFYRSEMIALMPMGFCYPGKGKSGDLPPRQECAPRWHAKLLEQMPDKKLLVLVGQYAQGYYLGKQRQKNLAATVKCFSDYLPDYFPLPHPSPRNRLWLRNNPWFELEVLPVFRAEVRRLLSLSASGH